MAKNRREKRRESRKDKTPSPQALMMSDLQIVLDKEEFESVDELKEVLQIIMDAGLPIPRKPPETPLEEAQELMYQAFDTSSRRKRIKLAKQALKLSPDCADAYHILALETAKTFEEARDLCEKAVRAGERAIGEEIFEKGAGRFWAIVETRPYMRARGAYADCLWETGEHQAAIEHFQDMLRLNPEDNQGVRHILIGCLLEVEDHAAALDLLKKYHKDTHAIWTYSWALCLFREKGATGAADSQLRRAIKRNWYVPAYLLGEKHIPRGLPTSFMQGSREEAVWYAADDKSLWEKTPGALGWLQQAVAKPANPDK